MITGLLRSNRDIPQGYVSGAANWVHDLAAATRAILHARKKGSPTATRSREKMKWLQKMGTNRFLPTVAASAHYGLAIAYGHLGDNDRAFEQLEQCYRDRLSITATPMPEPFRPWAHAVEAFTASV